MANIYFPRKNRIYYHCRRCDIPMDITKLVKYLRGCNRSTVPTEYYKAWKILVLGTKEYESLVYDTEHQIILRALDGIEEV